MDCFLYFRQKKDNSLIKNEKTCSRLVCLPIVSRQNFTCKLYAFSVRQLSSSHRYDKVIIFVAAQRNKSSDESRERPPSETSRSRRHSVDNASATRSHSTVQRKGNHGAKPSVDKKLTGETALKSKSRKGKPILH